jgi:hypothetical protein
MARQARLDIPLAEASGVSATALGRLGIVQLLARQELIMGGEAGGQSDLDAFVAELRAANPKLANDLERALAGLDAEADGSSDAAGLYDCLTAVARTRLPIEKKLKLMMELCEFRGTVAVPRELLHPKPTNREG